MMKNWQELFPNKLLIVEEIQWCEKFENNSMFEPIGTYDVRTEADFLDMIEQNHRWLEDHINTVISTSSRSQRELPYFQRIKHGE